MLDIIFPPKCIFCRKVLAPGAVLEICKECSENIPFIKGKVCMQCGQPLGEVHQQPLCFDCRNDRHYFKQGISVFEYKGTVKRAIIRFKFYKKERYAITLGKIMSKKLSLMTNWPIFDIITYTPISKKRFQERGFNQAQLLANVIAQQLQYPLGKGILLKVRETQHQSVSTRRQRQRNMLNAFMVSPKVTINDASILLVDDVYTTGATVNECARVLISAGAKEVYVITAAIGKGAY